MVTSVITNSAMAGIIGSEIASVAGIPLAAG